MIFEIKLNESHVYFGTVIIHFSDESYEEIDF